MAQIVGGLATSHIPAIGNAIARGKQQEPYWKPFFDGFAPIHAWLQQVQPEVVVVFYNDHGLNFFLDKLPAFAIGAANEYRHADEGWGIPTTAPLAGCPELSWHLVEQLTAAEFDLTVCQEMQVDHACTIPFQLLWPDQQPAPVQIVPIHINTVQFPLPTARRVYELGRVVGRAIGRWDDARRVAVMGTGGLSHQLEGERAGFINKRFDLQFLQSMETNPQWATQFSDRELVELAGTQGVELLMWLAMRAALTDSGSGVRLVHRHYHIPISNTATGVIALEVLP